VRNKRDPLDGSTICFVESLDHFFVGKVDCLEWCNDNVQRVISQVAPYIVKFLIDSIGKKSNPSVCFFKLTTNQRLSNISFRFSQEMGQYQKTPDATPNAAEAALAASMAPET
jgi:hypothetical protein